MFRKLANKFSKSMGKRSVGKQREVDLPIKVTFERDKGTSGLQMPFKECSIKGITKDLSESEIAFVVSSIRVHEYYLVGEGRTLNAEVTLPNGKIQIQLEGDRYEQIGGEHLSINQYIVGAKILNMSEDDKLIYFDFLNENEQITGAFKLGIDEGKA